MGKMSDDYKAHLAAWKRGDMEAALSYIDDNIEWYPNRSMRVVNGKAKMREFLGKFATGMSDIFYEQSLMIEQGNLFGVQFHPEKSQQAGLTILKNFVAIR